MPRANTSTACRRSTCRLKAPRAREDLLRTGAVKLFLARARAAQPDFSLDAHAAAIIAAICRRLDGIPLAIELAAARSEALGIEGLAARLDDRFRLLTGGHRTALPRHQTLRATLDWSYELLSEFERAALCRLAIFAGNFTLDAANAVAANADSATPDVVESLVNLVAKSLVTADVRRDDVHYRLLDTTRAYAFEKLSQSGEHERCARRHAEYYRGVFEKAAIEWETRPGAEWLATYAHQIDNVRAALDWAFSARGDASIGIALTVASVPLWFQLSLLDECRGRIERARAEPGARLEHRHAARDAVARSVRACLSSIPEGPCVRPLPHGRNALELAQDLGDIDYQLQALWGLWADRITGGEYRVALELAQRFCALAATRPESADVLIGDRLLANVLIYLGDLSQARLLFERGLNRQGPPVHRSQTARFLIDLRSSARAMLAHILWLQGYPDQALRTAQWSVAEAACHRAWSVALFRNCDGAVSYRAFDRRPRASGELGDDAARSFRATFDLLVRLGALFPGLVLTKRVGTTEGLYALHSRTRRSARDRIRARVYVAAGTICGSPRRCRKARRRTRSGRRCAGALRTRRREMVHSGSSCASKGRLS